MAGAPWAALAVVLGWRRPRRALVFAVVLLLAAFAFEDGLHSVHHLAERSQPTKCAVAAAAAHLTATAVDDPGTVDVILPVVAVLAEVSQPDPATSFLSPVQRGARLRRQPFFKSRYRQRRAAARRPCLPGRERADSPKNERRNPGGCPLRISIIVAILLLATSAGAQPKTSPEPIPTLTPVVVPGSPSIVPDRTATTEEAREEIRSTVPGGAEVVGETTIKESLGANLRSVLDFVPGVLVRSRFGLADESQFSIRGAGLQNNFHNRDVNFLFNSFMYGQADGFSDFESIELMDVKRIEVFKGANALRYGANSIGGAVNFVTKTGYDAGPIEYWGEGGSYGFFKQHLATGRVRGPFDLYGGVTVMGLAGYRQHSQQQRQRFNTSSGCDFGGGMTARLDLGFVRSLENLPGALTRPQFESIPSSATRPRPSPTSSATTTTRTAASPSASRRREPAARVADPAQLPGPLPSPVLRHHRPDHVQLEPGDPLHQHRPIGGYRNLLTAGFQYFGTQQNNAQQQNLRQRAPRRAHQERGRPPTITGSTGRTSSTSPHRVPRGGRRLQYSYAERPRPALQRPLPRRGRQRLGQRRLLRRDPQGGRPSGRSRPTVQVYGNASRAYQPPAPAGADGARPDSPGSARRPPSRHAWQFEIGDARQLGPARELGHLRVRLRGVGRDPERQRPALPGRALHHSALPEHSAARATWGSRSASTSSSVTDIARSMGLGQPETSSAPASPIPIRTSAS